MNAQQLIAWMTHPEKSGRETSAQLDTLTQTFPYFQTAHLLYVKSLHNENSFLYNNQLKVAAAYATNRKVLYELITKKGTGDEGRGTGDEGRGASEKNGKEKNVVEEIETVAKEIVQPEFPKKRFVTNPDDWESGMLRQLQLLHHWKVKGTGDEGQGTRGEGQVARDGGRGAREKIRLRENFLKHREGMIGIRRRKIKAVVEIGATKKAAVEKEMMVAEERKKGKAQISNCCCEKKKEVRISSSPHFKNFQSFF